MTDDLAHSLDLKPWWVWRTHPYPPKRMTERHYEEGAASRRRSRRTDIATMRDVEIKLPLPYMRAQNSFFRDPQRRVDPGSQSRPPGRAAAEHHAWGRARDNFTMWFAQNFDKIMAGSSIESTQSAEYALSKMRQGHAMPGGAFIGRMTPADGFGSMLCVSFTDVYTKTRPIIGPGDGGADTTSGRAQRRDFLLTPPVHMFCDLTGTYSFEDIGPTTFWIQPEVHAETGEIMQGSPIGAVDKRGKRTSAHGVKMSLTNQELQKALDGQLGHVRNEQSRTAQKNVAATVRIALDAFLERGEADPRFVDPATVYEMTGPEPF